MKNPSGFYKLFAKRFPLLKEKLEKAQMPDTPEQFIRKAFTLAGMSSFAFSFLFLFPIFYSLGQSVIIPILCFPVIFFMMFSYFMKLPDLYIRRIEKDITKELLFALRFLIIELESGVQVYKAFSNIKRNYPIIGKYFGEVVDMVEYGTNMDEALNIMVRKCPSENLRLVFVQIQNSMKTGADVVLSLNTAVDQFTREQHIMVDEYSKKLNPVAMFYMIIAVIFPSIGFMMIIVISSFVGFKVDLPILFFIVGLIAFMQFMFVSIIKSMRPPVEF